MLSLLLTGCEMSNSEKYEIPQSEKSVNHILHQIAYSFKKNIK